MDQLSSMVNRKGVPRMEFRDVVLKRRMVRNFADTPVAPEIIDRILDLARHAPALVLRKGSLLLS